MNLIVTDLWTWVQGNHELCVKPTSYFVDGAWFSQQYKQGFWDGRKRFGEQDSSRGMWRFPTGLLVDVCEHLNGLQVEYQINDLRELPQSAPCYVLGSNDGELRLDEGKYAYQAEVLDTALLNTRGILKVATNGGKTEIGAAIIKSVGGQWAWITHKKGLLHQTRERLQERLGESVGILGDSEEDLQRVTVCMVQTIDSVFRRSGREHCRDWCRTCCGFIGDEMHHADSDQWFNTFCEFPAAWRFGLTATPPLPQSGGMALQALTGGILTDISSLFLIQQGVSVPPRIWYMESPEVVIKKSAKWPTVYRDGIVENAGRHELIADAAARFRIEAKPHLILVNRLNHGGRVMDAILERGISFGWINGKVPHSQREDLWGQLEDGTINAVVAMSECCGEGTNIPFLDALTNATGTRGGGNAQEEETGRSTIQFIGRGLRSRPGKKYFDYVDFVDTSHKALRKATQARIETLESEGYGQFIKYWSNYVAG